MMTKTKYRSLDLVKGLARGWGRLNGRETQVMLYVAQHGRQNEEGFAFVWHPMKGVDWWYQDMDMPRATFYKTIASLKKKGHLVATPATATWAVEGYGIPVHTMQACHQRSLRSETEPVSEVRLGCLESETDAPPLTCDDEPHNQGSNQGINQLLTQPPQEAAVQEDPVFDDDFSTPKDETDDFAVPKEAKTKAKRKTTPQHRLMKEFHEQWSIARCRNTSFGVAYNNQGAIMATFKRLLETYSEDDLTAMIKVFFDQAAAGRMRLSGNEMWRDFLNNQAEVWRIVQSSGTVSAPMDDAEEHNERVREARRLRRMADQPAQVAAMVPA